MTDRPPPREPKPDKLALSDLNAETLVVIGFTWLLWSLLMLALGSLLVVRAKL